MPSLSYADRCEYCGCRRRDNGDGWEVISVVKSDDSYSMWTEQGGYCADCQLKHQIQAANRRIEKQKREDIDAKVRVYRAQLEDQCSD